MNRLKSSQPRLQARAARIAALWLALVAAAPLAAEVRVQDIARLQGQRTNRLMGFGIVVGLAGTGDGGKYANTTRALMALHRRFEQPVLDANELRGNNNVALVTVEALIPEFGAGDGHALDVTVAAIGPAKSLKGGQLLTTPLQESTLTVPDVLALAAGRLELTDPTSPTRATIRGGATLEQDFHYYFIEDQTITLVLADSHAGWPFSQMVARAINHEIATPVSDLLRDRANIAVLRSEEAVAIGPRNVRVRIPAAESAQPAGFITRVLQTPLFVMPHQPARVVINRQTRTVSFTGNVTVSPAALQIPNLGTVVVGGEAEGAGEPDKDAPADFQALLDALTKIKLPAQQIVETIEHLHRSGALHAQLIYTE